MIKRFFYGVTTILFVVCFAVFVNAIELEEPPDYKVAGVIGASYENGQTGATHPMAPNSWYLGGSYKTWVDYIPCFQDKNFHWLNLCFSVFIAVMRLKLESLCPSTARRLFFPPWAV